METGKREQLFGAKGAAGHNHAPVRTLSVATLQTIIGLRSDPDSQIIGAKDRFLVQPQGGKIRRQKNGKFTTITTDQ